MKLSDQEKNQMQLLDEQVLILQEKNAGDDAIVLALKEFIPYVISLIDNMPEDELKFFLNKHQGVSYFIALLDFYLNSES